MTEPNIEPDGDELSEQGATPPPGWPNQRPVVDGVQEVSQDPDLFADDEDPEVYGDDPADSEGGA